jgi:hypothetical protein
MSGTRYDRRLRRLPTLSLCALAWLLPFVRAQAEVAVDSFSGGSVHQAAAGSVVTWHHAVGSPSAERLLVVVVMISPPASCSPEATVASVTYAGKPMLQSGAAHSCVGLWMFHLVGPPAGKHDVVVTLTAPADTVVGSYSFSGVDPASPLRQGGGMRTCSGVVLCSSWAAPIAGGYFLAVQGFIDPSCFGGQPPQVSQADFGSVTPFILWNAKPSSGIQPDGLSYSCFSSTAAGSTYVLGVLGINPKAPLSSSIAGHVSSPDKTPRAGVRIDLQGSSAMTGESVTRSATTDSSGAYSFSGLTRSWDYTLTPMPGKTRFRPATGRANFLAADQTIDFVAESDGAPAGKPLLQWQTQPNPRLKGQLGRLVIAFPHGVNVSGTSVQVFAAGGSKALHSGVGAQAQTLPAGNYDVSIGHARITGVPVEAASDTQLKVGVLRISVSNQTRFFVLSEDRKDQLVNSYGKQTIGLPVGNYYVRIGSEVTPVTISEGQVTDF